MSSETPFKAIPTADDDMAVHHERHPPYIRTITLLPSGPDWISRQTEEEILSIPAWGWSDGTATVPRQEIVDIFHQMALLKKLIFASAILTGIWIAVWVLNGSPLGVHSSIFIVFVVIILIRITLDLVSIRLSNKLKDKFSEGVLTKTGQNTDAIDGGQKIQVTIRNVLWVRRQTDEEILSIEGWTEHDLDDLVPFLERRKILRSRVNLVSLLVVFGVWAWLIPMYIYPESELLLKCFWISFVLITVIECVGFHLLCSFTGMNVKLSEIFFNRFMNPRLAADERC